MCTVQGCAGAAAFFLPAGNRSSVHPRPAPAAYCEAHARAAAQALGLPLPAEEPLAEYAPRCAGSLAG
jgi:hypothetical protein